MGESERNMVVNFLWVWWDTRNKLNAGEQARPLAEVLYKTMEMASSADQLNLGKKNVPGAIRMEKNEMVTSSSRCTEDQFGWSLYCQ
jgi:hypothetical protein